MQSSLAGFRPSSAPVCVLRTDETAINFSVLRRSGASQMTERTSHPLQVGAGYNQLIPLFVTMTDRELFHAGR
jgi:hypothetical protein